MGWGKIGVWSFVFAALLWGDPVCGGEDDKLVPFEEVHAVARTSTGNTFFFGRTEAQGGRTYRPYAFRVLDSTGTMLFHHHTFVTPIHDIAYDHVTDRVYVLIQSQRNSNGHKGFVIYRYKPDGDLDREFGCASMPGKLGVSSWDTTLFSDRERKYSLTSSATQRGLLDVNSDSGVLSVFVPVQSEAIANERTLKSVRFLLYLFRAATGAPLQLPQEVSFPGIFSDVVGASTRISTGEIFFLHATDRARSPQPILASYAVLKAGGGIVARPFQRAQGDTEGRRQTSAFFLHISAGATAGVETVGFRATSYRVSQFERLSRNGVTTPLAAGASPYGLPLDVSTAGNAYFFDSERGTVVFKSIFGGVLEDESSVLGATTLKPHRPHGFLSLADICNSRRTTERQH